MQRWVPNTKSSLDGDEVGDGASVVDGLELVEEAFERQTGLVDHNLVPHREALQFKRAENRVLTELRNKAITQQLSIASTQSINADSTSLEPKSKRETCLGDGGALHVRVGVQTCAKQSGKVSRALRQQKNLLETDERTGLLAARVGQHFDAEDVGAQIARRRTVICDELIHDDCRQEKGDRKQS